MDNSGKEEPNADQPRKKGLDLSIFLRPVAEANTSIGRVFLFRLRVSDIGAFEKLPDLPSAKRIRCYLPCIASLSADYSLDKERVAITAEQVDQLSDDEVDALAEIYASSSAFWEAREGSKDRSPVAREPGEAATAYLDKLLRNEIEEQGKLSRKMMESMRGSTQGIFDQVRKSSLELGDSWRQLERLTKASTISKNITPAFETKSLEFSNHMAEHTARMARERTEDREMLRLTAETSAKSAKTLQELADAASMMLEKLDERDADAKRTTKTQLWIAVGSVVVSAILAGASFIQDRTSNKSGDEWQLAVLSELKASNERGASIQTENQLLRDQVLRLSSTIAVLEGKINTLPLEAKQVSTSKKRR